MDADKGDFPDGEVTGVLIGTFFESVVQQPAVQVRLRAVGLSVGLLLNFGPRAQFRRRASTLR